VAQRVVFITFDDGFGTMVEHALPALAERALTATLFLATAFVAGARPGWRRREDHRRLLGLATVRDAVSAGFGDRQPCATVHLELDIIKPHDLEEELVSSQEDPGGRTPAVVQSLAYPFGYHDRRVRETAWGRLQNPRASGLRACTEEPGSIAHPPCY